MKQKKQREPLQGTVKTIPQNKKRVVIFRMYSGFGGIERQIISLIERLVKDNWELTLVSDMASPMTEAAEKVGSQTILLQKNSALGQIFELRSICRRQKAAILQAHMFYESILCRGVKMLLPKLHCVFRVHTYIDCSQISRWKKNIYHFLAWLTAPWVNRYISINEFNVKEMRKRTHLGFKKISVVHNTLRQSVASFEASEEYLAAESPNRIAMIANFVDFKGHDILLEGLRLLRDRGYTVKARLIGGVPGQGTELEDKHRLQIVLDTIEEYHLENQTEVYGVSGDIPTALRDCSIVVLPSDSEGTPNVLLEGMWLKKLVVASEVGGVPEFVKEGETGFLHPPKDPEGFAQAIIRALELSRERRNEILKNARKTVEKEYLITSVFQKLCVVYSELLGE